VEEGVTIIYMGGSQFELIGSQGNRVLIDVFQPDKLSALAADADILLTSTGLAQNDDFVESFAGQQLFTQEGQINMDNVSISSIAAGRSPSQLDRPAEGGSNYIFLIEMDGLRIAHLGEIGQEELSAEQLDFLGEVDIALMQFVNNYSMINATNQIGYNLMKQLQPKMIIPTHGSGSMDAVELADENWDVSVVLSDTVRISTDDLPDETLFLIIGDNATPMKSIYDFAEWTQ
jgi:hypothetical protein